jgi:aryl-alcohol dehydrogenase-like predicted oxidoreductase
LALHGAHYVARVTAPIIGCVVRHVQAKLRASPQLAGDSAIDSDAAAALQVARSTPYVISAIVGHKTPAHVDENLKVVQAELLERQTFLDLMQGL